MQKRYIFLILVVISVGFLIWHVSSSYAYVNQGYEGNNIVTGDKWGVNIVKISEVTKEGDAELIGDISTIGTTLNFNAVLFNPGDKISFNVSVSNTGNLDAELYALTLTGLSMVDSENINYSIMPLDYLLIHNDEEDGSILKKNEKQDFIITLEYDPKAPNNNWEYNLSLGSTIIYKQR